MPPTRRTSQAQTGSRVPLTPSEPGEAPTDGRRIRGNATRAAIVSEAVQLASTDGLGGLTMAVLAERLAVPKSSVHAAFGSKQDLQLAVLAETRRILIDHVVSPALAAPAGYPRLVALGDTWIRYLESEIFDGGCILSSAASELDGQPGATRQALVAIMTEWLDFLADNVKVAITNGDFSPTTKPDRLAVELHSIGLTANWHYQLFQDNIAFETARATWTNTLSRPTPERSSPSPAHRPPSTI